MTSGEADATALDAATALDDATALDAAGGRFGMPRSGSVGYRPAAPVSAEPTGLLVLPSGRIPGWALRVGLLVAAAGAAAVSMASATGVGAWSVTGVALMALVLITAVAPGSAVPALLLIGVVGYRLMTTGPQLDPGLAVLVALLPLIHQLSGIAAMIPARARLSARVLRPAAFRYLQAVVPVELALLVAALLF